MNTIYSLFPLIRLCLRDQVLNWTPHKYHSDICNISLSLQEASWHSPSPVSTIDHTMGPRSSLSITRIKRCPPLRWSPAQPGLWEVMFFYIMLVQTARAVANRRARMATRLRLQNGMEPCSWGWDNRSVPKDSPSTSAASVFLNSHRKASSLLQIRRLGQAVRSCFKSSYHPSQGAKLQHRHAAAEETWRRSHKLREKEGEM